MKQISKNIIFGYTAGIIAGASYGLNPLFAKPLLNLGVEVTTMLFFRYFVAMLIMAGWILIKKETFKINKCQLLWLISLGFLFCGSSTFLFMAYKYIPSGLATTLIYLYPVFTAIIMVFLKVYPSWQVWISIFATLGGVMLLCMPEGNISLNPIGIVLSIASGLSYTLYLIVINRAKALQKISAPFITFWSLLVGSILLFVLMNGPTMTNGISSPKAWWNIIGLAIFPTIISLVTLALSSRLIGPTRTSVLGVFEPITAIFIGTILFSEPLTTNALIGIIICIVAVLYMIIAAPQKISAVDNDDANTELHNKN